MKLLQRIKERYAQYRDANFLQKHHCASWDEYHYIYDTDIRRGSFTVKAFYHGYPHIVTMINDQHYAYKLLYDYGPGGCRYGYEDMIDYCKEHAQNKFRCDTHRVILPSVYGQEPDEYVMNEMSGHDVLFFAFKNERDCLMFTLRWL